MGVMAVTYGVAMSDHQGAKPSLAIPDPLLLDAPLDTERPARTIACAAMHAHRSDAGDLPPV
jgi:hypothetical protein